ncbi:MAG: hypothetical protein ACOH5I_17470 [Oligoflexus sp.]
MRIVVAVWLYLIVAWVPQLSASPGLVTAGQLDLSSWDFSGPTEVSLRGEWEFYWEKLYQPKDFASQIPTEKNLLQVPANWAFKGYPAYGYATYRLRVQLSQPRELAIRLPWIQASAKIFIDGKLLEEIGHVHTSRDPQRYSHTVKEDYYIFEPQHADFDIVIQVANFSNLIAGMAGTPTLGTVAAIKATYIKDIALVIFFSGCVFIMGVYHFCLYALRTKARSTLYFGMICVTVSLYMFASHLPSVTSFLPNISAQNATRFYL